MRNTADFSKADQVIRQALSEEAFTSANLLVGKGDRVLFRRAYGRLSMEDDAPLTTEHTRYDLASITKPLVISMLTLRAMETGKLCLWDQLGTFVDAPDDKQNITIGQILTHTAGFTTGLHLWELGSEPSRTADLLLRAPLRYRPYTQPTSC
jgi:CubicO group peptidase (beta-lactamase class C family)